MSARSDPAPRAHHRASLERRTCFFRSLRAETETRYRGWVELPRRLGPYRLEERLGHGGMAEVFLATAFGASGFEKRVAIKTLLPQFQGDGELERLLIEEAKRGARLTHRNVVHVHDLGTAEGIYYVCMDYVDGADLGTLHATGGLPVELALLVVEEVALALVYAHELRDARGRPLGLVHRDVSPSNVLVSRHGDVKLADFGIAKATKLAETTAANIRRGKYAYMSPEQIAGHALGSASDQFGLGVLIELLAGTRPFDGDSPAETMDRIRDATPPALDGWPADLRGLARRCVARDPRERFATTRDLRHALAAVRRARAPVSVAELATWVADRLRASVAPAAPPPTRPQTIS